MGTQALLSVSFGTTVAETREKTIDALTVKLGAAFPERVLYSAWTSSRIVAKVRERGEIHDTLDEAFERLAADGVDDLLVATSCLMQGHEMRKIEQAAANWAAQDASRVVRIARPLLATPQDCAELARVVRDELSGIVGDEVLLLMGHGSPHGSNEAYEQVQDGFGQLGCSRYFVATVEGKPAFDDVVDDVLACDASRVYLAPLMFVAGNHALVDLAGDGEDSWQNMLRERDVDTVVMLRGLGEYGGVRQMVVDHALTAHVLETEE